MEIQTALIQALLYANMFSLGLLLQPYVPALRGRLTRFYLRSIAAAPLYHIFFVLYCMVLVIFVDSAFKRRTTVSPVLILQSERNFYLSGFTLFLALVFRRVCGVMAEATLTDEANKHTLKQHGNSMIFVNKVIEDAKREKEKRAELEGMLKELQEEAERNKGVLAEAENNRMVYLKLKDKYEKLREERHGESRKRK